MLDRYDENLILGYIEDELTADERAAFEKVLAQDEPVRLLVEQMRHDRLCLAAIGAEAAPSHLMPRVVDALERQMLLNDAPQATPAPAGAAATVRSPGSAYRFPHHYRRWGGAIAAALALAGGLTWYLDPFDWRGPGEQPLIVATGDLPDLPALPDNTFKHIGEAFADRSKAGENTFRQGQIDPPAVFADNSRGRDAISAGSDGSAVGTDGLITGKGTAALALAGKDLRGSNFGDERAQAMGAAAAGVAQPSLEFQIAMEAGALSRTRAAVLAWAGENDALRPARLAHARHGVNPADASLDKLLASGDPLSRSRGGARDFGNNPPAPDAADAGRKQHPESAGAGAAGAKQNSDGAKADAPRPGAGRSAPPPPGPRPDSSPRSDPAATPAPHQWLENVAPPGIADKVEPTPDAPAVGSAPKHGLESLPEGADAAGDVDPKSRQPGGSPPQRPVRGTTKDKRDAERDADDIAADMAKRAEEEEQGTQPEVRPELRAEPASNQDDRQEITLLVPADRVDQLVAHLERKTGQSLIVVREGGQTLLLSPQVANERVQQAAIAGAPSAGAAPDAARSLGSGADATDAFAPPAPATGQEDKKLAAPPERGDDSSAAPAAPSSPRRFPPAPPAPAPAPAPASPAPPSPSATPSDAPLSEAAAPKTADEPNPSAPNPTDSPKAAAGPKVGSAPAAPSAKKLEPGASVRAKSDAPAGAKGAAPPAEKPDSSRAEHDAAAPGEAPAPGHNEEGETKASKAEDEATTAAKPVQRIQRVMVKIILIEESPPTPAESGSQR